MSENVLAKPTEFVKKHPLIISAVILGAGVIFIFTRGSNAPAQAQTVDDPGAQAGTALQIASLQASEAAHQADVAGSVANQKIMGAVDIAQLQADTQQHSDALAASTAVALGGLQSQTAQAIASLQAFVTGKQIDSQTAINAANTAALVQVATEPYKTQIALAQMAYDHPTPQTVAPPTHDQLVYTAGTPENKLAIQSQYNYQLITATRPDVVAAYGMDNGKIQSWWNRFGQYGQ